MRCMSPNGWRLDVGKDFALRVDFHYSKRNLGDSWVMVTLLPSIQMPVSRQVMGVRSAIRIPLKKPSSFLRILFVLYNTVG